MKKAIIWILVGSALTFACIAPALFVQNATHGERLTWLGFCAIFLAFPGLAAVAGSKRLSPELAEYNRNMAKWPGYLFLLFFCGTVFLSIIFANMQDIQKNTASVARAFGTITNPIFPWVGNFRAARENWGLTDLQILKTESIVSLWFVFGLLASVAWIVSWLTLTPKERELESHLSDSVSKSKWLYQSSAAFIFSSLFILLMVAMAYFGLWEFDDDDSKCLINARCYVGSDLMIIAVAGTKCFVVFGFAGGLCLMVRKFFSQRP